MSARSGLTGNSRSGHGIGRFAIPVVVVALLGAMAFDTTIVRIGSDRDVQEDVFSPEVYGQQEFPRIQAAIEAKAVEAATLAPAIAGDTAAATEAYGTPSGVGPIFPVSFTGTIGEGRSGIFPVAVDGIPEELSIRVQTGPAINGTELRDATGEIAFGQFTNQIEYQNAGAALNNKMKAEILAELDRDALTGRTIAVVGVFRLINPKSWLVTPVRLAVQ